MNTTRQKRKSCEACSKLFRPLNPHVANDGQGPENSDAPAKRPAALVVEACHWHVNSKTRERPGDRENVHENRTMTYREWSEQVPQVRISHQFSPQATFSPQEAVNMLMGAGEFDSLPCGLSGNCGFDSSHWEMLGNGDICSVPLESWQTSQQNATGF